MRNWSKSWIIALTTATSAAILLTMFVSHGAQRGTAPAQGGLARISGKPDFSGIWEANNTANWDLQTHAARPMIGQPGFSPNSVVLAAPVLGLGSIGWVPGGLGVVDGEEIPYQPWAAQRKKENLEHWMDRDPEIKCFQPGVPRAMYMPHPFQIIQKPNELTILYEYVHTVRYIFANGTPHPKGPIEWWLGDSRGRWEGDTLVVDVVHFNDQTWFDRAGNFHSDALHVVERYSLVDPDHINYAVTIEDPKVFTRPWNMNMVLYRHKEKNFQLYEYECYGFDFEKLYPYPEIGGAR